MSYFAPAYGKILVYVRQDAGAGGGKCVGQPGAQPVSTVTQLWSRKLLLAQDNPSQNSNVSRATAYI